MELPTVSEVPTVCPTLCDTLSLQPLLCVALCEVPQLSEVPVVYPLETEWDVPLVALLDTPADCE